MRRLQSRNNSLKIHKKEIHVTSGKTLQVEYGEKKQAYDTLLLQLESGMSRLDAEVRKWQEEIMSNETKLHTLEQQMALLDMWQGRAEAELKVTGITYYVPIL